MYKAPATVAKPETANVTATIKDSKRQLMVVSTVTVIPAGISFRINGGSWIHFPGHSGFSDEVFEIAGMGNEGYFGIAWRGGTGGMAWKQQGEPALYFADVSTALNYESVYYEESLGRFVPAGGALHVSGFGGMGEYVSGSFTMSGGGVFTDNDREPIGKSTIQGYFCVRHDL